MIHDARDSFGGYLEDFQVGGRVSGTGPARTITEADNHLFSLLTMNTNPLHTDEKLHEGPPAREDPGGGGRW